MAVAVVIRKTAANAFEPGILRTAVKRVTTKPLRSGLQTVGLLPLWSSDGWCPCSAISSVQQVQVRRKRDVPNMGKLDSKSF